MLGNSHCLLVDSNLLFPLKLFGFLVHDTIKLLFVSSFFSLRLLHTNNVLAHRSDLINITSYLHAFPLNLYLLTH